MPHLPEPDPIPTITDEEWRSLQARALKANPQHADTFSATATESRHRAADNYRNRRSC